ncbi:MAG: VWA domain-containing protein [Balneolaceae bacterium]
MNSTYLWFLLLIPLLAGAMWWVKQIQAHRRSRFFDERLFTQLRRGFWELGQNIKVLFLLIALSLFVIGLAGPQIGTEVREMEQRGVNMMVVLDLSNSMNAEDIRPSRLDKAKFEIQRLIERSSGDRIGLLVFTGEAFVQSPMTLDYSALRLFLDIAETQQMPVGTTNFRAAFQKAAESFDSLEEQQAERAASVLLMFSDGEDHGPSNDQALEALISRGVQVFTVGIGTRDGARIPIRQTETNRQSGYHRDRAGNEVITRLEPDALRDIAQRGNGNYYEINSGTSGIDQFLARLDDLQKGEFSVQEYADYKNRYQLLLIAGILFFMAGLLMPEYKKAKLVVGKQG